jgi:hypothetical protein
VIAPILYPLYIDAEYPFYLNIPHRAPGCRPQRQEPMIPLPGWRVITPGAGRVL